MGRAHRPRGPGLRDATIADKIVTAANTLGFHERAAGVGKTEIGEDVTAGAFNGRVGGFHGVCLDAPCHGSAARPNVQEPDTENRLGRRVKRVRSKRLWYEYLTADDGPAAGVCK